MSTMSLDELKAQNAAEEEAAQAAEPEVVEELIEDEPETPEVEEPEGEPEEVEDESTESVESWMQGDEEEQDEAVVPERELWRIRKKLKADKRQAIEEKDEEVAQLRAEIEALKKAPVQQAAPQKLVRPKYSDHMTDEEYDQAMDNYEAQRNQHLLEQLGQQSAKTAQQQQQELQARRAQEHTEKQVNAHYERAGEMLQKHNIKPEVFEAAETDFRNSLESVIPNLGNDVADQLISRLGEGSEKVIFAVGRQKAKQDQLKASLVSDPSGLEAAMLLGEMKAEFQKTSSKKVSRAPKPAPKVNGDANVSSGEKALKRKYDAAHAKGDPNKAFSIKREAKRQQINTSKW
jgi:hypothetical protein